MMTHDMFELLVRAALSVSIAIAVVMILRGPVCRVFGARVAYAFWVLVPVALLANFLPAQQISIIEHTPVPAALASEADGSVSAATRSSKLSGGGAERSTLIKHARVDAAGTRPATPQSSIISDFSISDAIPLLVAIWIAGAFISLGALVLKQRRFLKEHGLKNIKRRFHVAAREDIGPVVIGILKPFIVVPKSFEKKFSKVERNLILAHEREHIRSGDLRVNLLAAIVQCLNWFNPFVHHAMRAFRVDQELACDERVMKRHGQHRRMYGATLLKSQVGMQSAPLGCMWGSAGASPLKQRLALLAQPKMTTARRAVGAAFCLISAALAGTAAWATIPAEYTVVAAQDTQQDTQAGTEVETEAETETETDEIEVEIEFDDDFDERLEAITNEAVTKALKAAEVEIARAEVEIERALAEAGLEEEIEALVREKTLIEMKRAKEEVKRAKVEMKREMSRAKKERAIEIRRSVERHTGRMSSEHAKGMALVEAIDDRRDRNARALIEDGADINYVAHGDGTPLMIATRRGKEDLVELLIEKGADVNLSSYGDGNALIIAAYRGEEDITKMLIDAGADVNAGVQGDGTPLIAAIGRGDRDIVDLLLDAGADVNVAEEGDGNPLIMAAKLNRRNIAKSLVERGADVNGYVPGDETPLINAAQQGHVKMAEFLIEKGADVNLAVERGGMFDGLLGNSTRSPLGQAKGNGHPKMVALLRKHGANDVPAED